MIKKNEKPIDRDAFQRAHASFSMFVTSFRQWRRRQRFYLRHSPLHWLCPCCSLVILLLLLVVLLLPNPFSSEYEKIVLRQEVHWQTLGDLLQLKAKVRNEPLIERNQSRPVVILLYTTVFLQRRFCSFSPDLLFGPTCPDRRLCQWTCDHQRLSQADAIIFHAYDIQYYQAKIPQRSETRADALWILWSDEPPSMIDYHLFSEVQFNWTISYKLNSEVSIGTYGLFTRRTFPLSESMLGAWIADEFARRTSGVLWFVSNCDASERLNYFFQMKNVASTVNVEGYGRCVDRYPMHWCGARTHCEHRYMSKFKYFLSFESNSCRDYISEKFYKAFHHGLIPIVLGPRREDYEQFAPNDSFIHLDDDGRDVERLMRRLEQIDRTAELFARFHQWRKDFHVITDPRALDQIRFCELCQRLQEHFQTPRKTFVKNLEEFFHQGC